MMSELAQLRGLVDELRMTSRLFEIAVAQSEITRKLRQWPRDEVLTAELFALREEASLIRSSLPEPAGHSEISSVA